VTNERNALPAITQETKRTWRRTRQDYSAGGVVYQHLPETDLVQIALIATHGGQRWQLPKGSREPGETSLATAIREVAEETGIESVQEAFLQTIDYWYWDTYQKEVPELVHKLVDFYLLHMVAGELTDTSYEVDAVGWFTPAEALHVMTFEGEKGVVQQALTLLHRDADHSESVA